MRLLNIFSQNHPPDLEEWVRGLLQRLKGDAARRKRARDFSRNGGGAPPGDGGSEGGFELPSPQVLATAGGSAVLMLWIFLGFFAVDASEQAVMFRLGNPIGVKESGLRWHLPLLEDYRIVNISEVRRVEVGFRNDSQNKVLHESLMLTGNLNIVDLQFVVQYALNDGELFLFENRFSNRRAEDAVQQAAESAMREVVGKNNIDFVLYEGREAIASETKSTMQRILDLYKTGIQVREVAIQNVQPPDQVQNAFEDAIKARQDLDRKINEGKAYANDIVPRAAGQAARLMENAEAYKQSNIARAQGEADRFTLLADEYQKAPEVTRRRLYLETMEKIMGRASKILIDSEGAGNLLYLPLDKMLRAGGGALLPREDETGGAETPADFDEFKDQLRRRISAGAEALEGRR